MWFGLWEVACEQRAASRFDTCRAVNGVDANAADRARSEHGRTEVAITDRTSDLNPNQECELSSFRLVSVVAGFCVALTSGTLSGTAAAQAQRPSTQAQSVDVRRLIPVGTFRVAVIDAVVPPRLQALLPRFQAAMQKNRAWAQSYARENARPGEPLPFHPNFGLSREEYAEMLRLMGQMKMGKTAEATVSVTAKDNRFTFNGGKSLPELTGIVVDLERNRVETPLGTTTASRPVRPGPEQKGTGAWSGVLWGRADQGAARGEGTLLNFGLGRLQQSGRGILYYDGRRLAGGETKARVIRVLEFDLPSK